uniref:Transmembrane protein 53 n=1 Tax=Timspurckia oligopyrenoides TaxID=708627 RepID=A0A7S0ZKA6_9RHOD|mmetsp:Transcript_7830/g.14206  ORF Transcript_7830/g.14206 Transcript_7830/m.14206 type:complete len:427 (+) Transcript_7830:121-1401(+)|eukprot:CAMPEP_0182444078 /NCGR_PEP_ID=MMETSP1172-20130603/2645_1 /TAXON_ID=708627 /ORGANISM="Timspurckia oligopyrenoides, Strain CCMP3278" /LENGTH=426 /DNA_ID=CAMNT_0024639547 /DNA_START=107 /DNA_END=1387 /DNA_ORIENTATION=+
MDRNVGFVANVAGVRMGLNNQSANNLSSCDVAVPSSSRVGTVVGNSSATKRVNSALSVSSVSARTVSLTTRSGYLVEDALMGGSGNGGSNDSRGNGGSGDDSSESGGGESGGSGDGLGLSPLWFVVGLRGKSLVTMLGSAGLVGVGGFMVARNLASLVSSVCEEADFITDEKGNAEERPLVIMLSWMGARKRHLERYKKYYGDMGYDVVLYLNGLGAALVPAMSQEQACRVAKLIERQPEGRPVIVHAFSIGTGIYGVLLDRIRDDAKMVEKLGNHVAGVIFDSGPAHIFPKDVAKGLYTVCPLLSKKMWSMAASVFFWATQARKSFGQAEAALANFQFPAPQLYFYSKDDHVVSNLQESVNHFIQENSRRGVEIQKQVWENSRHTAHLIMHPEEYMENLSSFLEKCLEQKRGQLGMAAAVAKLQQ